MGHLPERGYQGAMKKDGILDKYKTKETVTYRLTPKLKKEV